MNFDCHPGLDPGSIPAPAPFAASNQVAQAVTLESGLPVAAIDGFQMHMGKPIVVCLAEIIPDHGIDLGDRTFDKKALSDSLNDKDEPPPKQITLAATNPYKSAAIILPSDDCRTTGMDTLSDAKTVADRGVRIYVVGLRTVDGDVAAAEGMAIYLRLDEPTLREVARMTGGEYHYAGTAEKLRSVYESPGSRLTVQTQATELSGLLALVVASKVRLLVLNATKTKPQTPQSAQTTCSDTAVA